eukprot:TRINITY_DN1289_c0_g1_i5.p1 TRINITY_DN1289_c0_g1~~TRINITY_DN1289_c0_g1_i5.p1  ORF type:complete len:685 (+),score=273.24 TRINITY_DN1289_c0_g1_i5:86-2056(+)
MRALALGLFLGVASAIDSVLEQNRQAHKRFYPDFKYEGGLNADLKDGPPKPGRNPHFANTSLPYPDNLQWLLSVFNRGWGLPSSYIDILPNGQVYWATKTYLEMGAFDEFGRPSDLDSIIAIQERTLTRYGLNLYDAGVWEIALALWGRYDVAAVYERNVLYTSTTGAAGRKNGNPGGILDLRADHDDYQYGVSKTSGMALKTITYPGNVTHFTQDSSGEPSKTGVKTGPGATYYRIIGPNYQMVDPLTGHYANAWKYPWPNDDETTKWNTYGLIHFNDWKPITGENVWSAMLGPLQALGIATDNNMSNTTCGHPDHKPHLQCTFEDYDHTPAPVQLGITVLPGLEALQTTLGSLYHCPWGAKIFPPDPFEGENVSNENNFSSYAALLTLYEALNNYTKGCSSSDPLLSYGCTVSKKLADGLDKWFNDKSILSLPSEMPKGAQVVPQGGHVNSTGYHPVPINNVAGLAVDCQTWGMTVMGGKRMDTNWGAGTAYKVWQTTKQYAGYYKGNVLAGVGYTDLTDLNTSTPVAQNDIWSAEWTFGAINMAQTLADYYKGAGNQQYHDDLMKDAQSMYNEVTKLWPEGLRFPDGSYVYANRRFFIPWGWFSNPIAATCSTAWSVLQDLNYDPFHYWGGNKPALQIPPHLEGTHPIYTTRK